MDFRFLVTIACSSLLIAPFALSARAAELVTLHNGFTLNCSSRETISPEVVRLHLSADPAGMQNYMDVPADSIEAVEPGIEIAAIGDATAAALPAKKTDVAAIAQQSGETHHLNVALLLAVISTESAGNTHAVSRTGARGLMQLMPGTATKLGVTDSFSAEGNVNGGSAYLDQLLTRYHENIALALAAYNAGPAAVDRYHGIPPYRETQLYVAKVIRMWNRMVAGESSLRPSDRVESR